MTDLKDPITEWEGAIKNRVISIVAILCMLACSMCLIAPVFGPLIKKYKRQQYAIYENYEELAENDMKSIRIYLWAIAIIGWIIFIGLKIISTYTY